MKIKWFWLALPGILLFWPTMTFAQHNPKSWGDLGNGRYRNMILPADYSDLGEAGFVDVDWFRYRF